MNISSFNISLSEAEKFFKKLELFRMKGIKSINLDGVSSSFKNASQEESYFNAYNIGLGNYDYDFLLNDQSFFQFEFKENDSFIDIRYAFFQNPVNYKTYAEFLQYEIEEGNLNETPEQIGSLLEEEYNQFLNEQEINSNHTTIRYDSDFSNYTPLIHSVSHLHIGHRNNIRIPINKTITPLMFVLFVIKNVYYYEWKKIVSKDKAYLKQTFNKGLNGSIILKRDKWILNEELELFLT